MGILQRVHLYLSLITLLCSAGENPEIVYATDTVNIRKEATTESDSVGYLLKNDEIVKLGDDEDGWVKVLYHEEERYISGLYLTDAPPFDPEVDSESLGIFKITAYCGGSCCNGRWAGQTSTGAVPEEGVTVAVAPWVISYGSQVYIDGAGYRVAQDTGGFAKRNDRQIDLYFDSHTMADQWGVRYKEVWIGKKG